MPLRTWIPATANLAVEGVGVLSRPAILGGTGGLDNVTMHGA